MLILQIREKSSTDYVVIRDETGREVCRVFVSEVRGDKARLGFVAPHQVHVNRRPLDEEKFGKSSIIRDAAKNMGTCVVCHGDLSGRELDGTGMAHAVCAEWEKS